MSTTSLPSLPPELLHEIASHIVDTSDLASLSLTSRDWNAAATIVLYQRELFLNLDWVGCTVPSDARQACLLERTFVARPDLATLAKEVTIFLNDTDQLISAEGQLDYDDVRLATRVTKTVLSLGISIISLAMRGEVCWPSVSRFLDVLECLPIVESCLQSFTIGPIVQIDREQLPRILCKLPALTRLSLPALYLHNSSEVSSPLFSLQHLHVTFGVDSKVVQVLAASPTRETLSSVQYFTSMSDPADWSSFTNLKTVTLLYGFWHTAMDLSAESLSTCIAAESVQICHFTTNSCQELENRKMLSGIPSSTTSLDLPGVYVDTYIINWIRDGEKKWPNLRTIKLCYPLIIEWPDYLHDLYAELEEVCERRGVTREWVYVDWEAAHEEDDDEEW